MSTEFHERDFWRHRIFEYELFNSVIEVRVSRKSQIYRAFYENSREFPTIAQKGRFDARKCKAVIECSKWCRFFFHLI